ncbi:PTH2-domain-containing protein [Pterulicium gracile]|uniref:peptidyl-tRNA hydrolase n=1 Tax=Pterulicium gracile TaxID=1884261 RepID=A0A5C3QX04_9AGAR|nr:PTH2-domain-containing protein [Pterula gracilis]
MSTSLQSNVQASIVITLAIASLGAGYFLGSRGPTKPSPAPLDPPATNDTEQSTPDGDLSAITAGLLEPCKMVLIVRTDLKLKAGETAEHCSRATLDCFKVLSHRNPKLVRHWERTGQAKIALKAKSEQQILELEAAAKKENLCARLAYEKTTEASGTVRRVPTVLAVGPGPVEIVNRISGKLRLL